jgi:cardiolipin synthase A/B
MRRVPDIAVDRVWFWLGALLTIADIAIVVLLIPRIISQRKESGATLAWVFFIILVPVLGLIAFWVLGTTRLRLRRRRRKRIEAFMTDRVGPLTAAHSSRRSTDACPVVPELRHLTLRLDPAGPTGGNAVALFREGLAVFDEMIAALGQATHHAHLVYYIWEEDDTGARMRDALVATARRGVQVRLLLDDVGCYGTRAEFFAPLVEAGGEVHRFLPVNLLTRRLPLNFRNHRKVLIIDGRVAFTGGMNVGDDYLGLKRPWRDAHVRVDGPSVLRLQEIFAQDWYHQTQIDLARPEYFPDVPACGEEWVQFVASGPDDDGWYAIATLLFAAVNVARKRVWLETPYFVPDPPMAMALQTAALRGVDVRLILSSKLDHPPIMYAARSFYGELLMAGVKIYELPLMLHTKMVTIDGQFSTVGSANFDRRSFRLNFEANAFFYGPHMAQALERSFVATQAEARPIEPERFARRPAHQRFLEACMRVMAPVL